MPPAPHAPTFARQVLSAFKSAFFMIESELNPMGIGFGTFASPYRSAQPILVQCRDSCPTKRSGGVCHTIGLSESKQNLQRYDFANFPTAIPLVVFLFNLNLERKMKEIASLFTFFLCLCCSAVASNISNQTDKIYVGYTNVTDNNFRERVEIVEFPYNFFVPKQTDEWKECTQNSRGVSFRNCQLKTFDKKSPLNIKYFMVDLSSKFPIKDKWLEVVISEFLNQENFTYFTIFQKNSDTIHLEQNKDEQDYKKCNKNNGAFNCAYHKTWYLLAYNTPDSLRQGVAYDAKIQGGDLFMFYPLYSKDGIITTDVGGGLFVEENIKQAWEITNEVDSKRTGPIMRYTIQKKTFDDQPKTDFTNIFATCRTFIMDDGGHFSQYDECYCTCVQKEVDKRAKKITNPNAVAKEIIDASFGECDVLKYMAESVNETFRNVSKLPKNEQQCVREAIQKHINPYGGTPVNMCNIEQILLEIERSRC